MREINARLITEKVKELLIEANYKLPKDARRLIEEYTKKESNTLAKSVLQKIQQNLECASELDIPICQDTGMAVIFCEVGQNCRIIGNFNDAVNEGVRRAYREGYMRKSVVKDPLFERVNTEDNTPCIIYTSLTDTDRIDITVAPKGFGSENMSALKMFNPSNSEEDIIDFVVDTVRSAGGKPCPPLLVGVGIGGSFDYCAVLAKKALTRDVSVRNPDKRYAEMEEKILRRINALGIGPQGFGGDTTALAVNIEKYPTHIAGLPVAVNINCHVMRHSRGSV